MARFDQTAQGWAAKTVVSGRATVATANVAVPLSPGQEVNSVAVKALDSNASPVFVGGSDVTAANGYPLKPGEPVNAAIFNLSTVWIVSATPGEGVVYLGLV